MPHCFPGPDNPGGDQAATSPYRHLMADPPAAVGCYLRLEQPVVNKPRNNFRKRVKQANDHFR